ncbi:MAG TPA: hypothetical protein VGV93_11680 [Acidimicrobiales bacterium]|nr:hypothetical protein [Acidimicrobiales bacterium]
MHPKDIVKGAKVTGSKRTIASALVAVTAMLALAGPAAAASEAQRFTVLLGGDVDRVIAAGPVKGVGVLETDSHEFNPDDGSVVVANRFVFDGGTLLVTFRGQAQLEPVATCVTRTAIDGTFEITGGTGIYEGARGGGTFIDRGVFVTRRTSDGCSDDGVFRAIIRATGTITLPDGAERAA